MSLRIPVLRKATECCGWTVAGDFSAWRPLFSAAESRQGASSFTGSTIVLRACNVALCVPGVVLCGATFILWYREQRHVVHTHEMMGRAINSFLSSLWLLSSAYFGPVNGIEIRSSGVVWLNATTPFHQANHRNRLSPFCWSEHGALRISPLGDYEVLLWIYAPLNTVPEHLPRKCLAIDLQRGSSSVFAPPTTCTPVAGTIVFWVDFNGKSLKKINRTIDVIL